MKQDKLLHALSGYCIASIFTIISPLFGLVVSIAIGALKELMWDKYLKKGKPEWLDLIATIAGAVIWVAVYLLIN